MVPLFPRPPLRHPVSTAEGSVNDISRTAAGIAGFVAGHNPRVPVRFRRRSEDNSSVAEVSTVRIAVARERNRYGDFWAF